MAKFRIFYSWQSDRPSQLCRQFIDIALRGAAEELSRTLGIAIEIDSDTQNEPGTPPITDTILRKIRECDAFVGDMTFVATTEGGKLVPNPNVMGEYGYALSRKGTRRILLAMNTAFGPPEQLPFDLSHLRHPTTFEAPPDMSDGSRRAARASFTRSLVDHLRVLVEHSRAAAQAEQAGTPEAAERAREGLQALTSSASWIGRPAIVSSPRVAFYLAPFAAFTGQRLDIHVARQAMSTLAPTGLGAADGGVDESQWWVTGARSVVPGKPNPETLWYARLLRPGVFEAELNIGHQIDDDPRILIDGFKVEAAFVDLLDKCSLAAGALGLSGKGFVSAALILGPIEADVLMSRLSGRFRKPSVGLGEVTLEAVGQSLGDHLQPIFDALWMGAGIAEGSMSFRQDGWAGYRGERAYEL